MGKGAKAATGHRKHIRVHKASVEQLADDLFLTGVVALAELDVTDPARSIDEVRRRPVPVGIGVPRPIVGIECNRRFILNGTL